MYINQTLAVVTGASGGLGEATARALATEGAHVILLARSKDKLEKIEKEIIVNGGKANMIPVDLSKAKETERTCKRILKDFGIPDILINNVGIGQWKPIEETTVKENEYMMNVPYFAAFNVTQAFSKGMIERNSGHIVNVTSPASEFPIAGAVSYAVARWAMRGFSQALWADLAYTKIGVSLYVGGKISSDYFLNNPGSEEKIPKINKLVSTLTPAQAAQGIIKCIKRNRKVLVQPFMMWLFYQSRRFMPGFVDWLVIKTGWRR